jgi:ubiquinone/menaquinone biosynthesis C-methylase UbiE
MSIPSASILLDAEAILLKSGVHAGSVVADLGCGTTGHFVIPAAKMTGPTGKVYAVDILKTVLAAVESRAKLEGATSIQTLWGNCEESKGVRLPDNTTDITLVVNNMYQSKARRTFLAEAARITKNGGKVVVVDWKTIASPLGPPAESRVSSEAIKLDAVAADLKLIDAWEPAPYFWGLIFTK